MEHILFKHLESNYILKDCQQWFTSTLTAETQAKVTIHHTVPLTQARRRNCLEFLKWLKIKFYTSIWYLSKLLWQIANWIKKFFGLGTWHTEGASWLDVSYRSHCLRGEEIKGNSLQNTWLPTKELPMTKHQELVSLLMVDSYIHDNEVKDGYPNIPSRYEKSQNLTKDRSWEWNSSQTGELHNILQEQIPDYIGFTTSVLSNATEWL